MALQALHKACGCPVTKEYKDYATYHAVYETGTSWPVPFEDESMYIGDCDANETGLYCSQCDEWLGEDDCIPGEEYVPVHPKLDSVMMAHGELQVFLEVIRSTGLTLLEADCVSAIESLEGAWSELRGD